MPRYFIDVRSRFCYDEDLEGIELPCSKAAHDEALRVASCKLQGVWRHLSPEARSDIALEVIAETGQAVLTICSGEIEQHLKAP